MLLSRIKLAFCATVFALLPATELFAHGISEEARKRMLEGGDLQYLILGAEHMLTGYDHLLFLFGVLFFLTRFTAILKFVSAFTLGHTITLIAATYMGITVNYYLIDAAIALTVIYKAFENLDGFRRYLNTGSPNLLVMVFVFGLVHGFGLSTRLQQLPIREDSGLLGHILSFNVGVEIGQIVALALMWGILRSWRHTRSFAVASGITNGILMALGTLLLIMQMHGYWHIVGAEEFPISKDSHAHAHEELNSIGHAHNPDGSHPPGVPDHGPDPAGNCEPGQARSAACRTADESEISKYGDVEIPDHT